MSNRDDWENVATEIEGLGRQRLVTELHNAFVAGQESIDERTPRKRIAALEAALDATCKALEAACEGKPFLDLAAAAQDAVRAAVTVPKRSTT